MNSKHNFPWLQWPVTDNRYTFFFEPSAAKKRYFRELVALLVGRVLAARGMRTLGVGHLIPELSYTFFGHPAASNLQIIFDCHEAVSLAMQDKEPAQVTARMWRQNAAELGDSGNATVRRLFMFHDAALFVHYFETWKDKLPTNRNKQKNDWPPAWRFGWVVRNSLAHGEGFNIEIRDPNVTVSFCNIALSDANNGQPIWNYLAAAELILLMDAMDIELDLALGPLLHQHPVQSSANSGSRGRM